SDVDAMDLACASLHLASRHPRQSPGRTPPNLRDRAEAAAELLISEFKPMPDDPTLLDRASRILQQLPLRTATSPEARLPTDTALLRDAAVVLDPARILAVGPATQLLRDHPDAAVTDLASHVLLPGLINPHTHLELSSGSCDPPSASFTGWIKSLRTRLGW